MRVRIFNSLSIENNLPQTAVALGFFDGVHKGHAKVIDAAVYNGKNLTPAVFTFTFSNNLSKKGSKLLCGYEERQNLLQNRGVEIVLCPDFSEFSALDPEEFVKEVLVSKLNASMVFCGRDYRFGKNASGNAEDLKRICAEYSIDATVIDDGKIGDEKISTSLIKEYLAAGEIEKVNSMLGREYCISSVVAKGNNIGEKLGFPTINQSLDENLCIPKFGVYASMTKIGSRTYNSVTNIGVKPTVSDKRVPNCETFLFDFSEKIYGEKPTVSLLEFIREERKFNSISELKAQIELDIKTAKDRITIKEDV